MTSAIIVQIQTRIEPDPNEETAALLRVLIHKIDNTTFGGDVPPLPQWTGPLWVVTRVQCVLCASLAMSLLAAFFAMLGKQWLNRYGSIDMQGSAIERSQDRQRKLDGIFRWHFDYVLECLPLMLQFPLFLIGCALVRYLWETSIAVAVVVIGMTSFGVLFYVSIVCAGTASESCPYQTPLSVVFRLFIKHPRVRRVWIGIRGRSDPDKYATTPERQATALDFRCISWMLRTSLDKTVNLSTLGFLKTILALPDSNPNSDIVTNCFNIFRNCFFAPNNASLSITRGSEQLVEISAMCFFCAFSSLLTAEPTSATLEDVRQRYKISQLPANLQHLPSPMRAFHRLFIKGEKQPNIAWTHYNPSSDELVPFARALDQATQFNYMRKAHTTQKVPRWLVRFAFRFLSQDPPPPTSVLINCLNIIAVDLAHDFWDPRSKASEERCVHP